MAATTFIIGLLLGGVKNFNAVLINGFFIVIIANIPQGKNALRREFKKTNFLLGLPITLSTQVFNL